MSAEAESNAARWYELQLVQKALDGFAAKLGDLEAALEARFAAKLEEAVTSMGKKVRFERGMVEEELDNKPKEKFNVQVAEANPRRSVSTRRTRSRKRKRRRGRRAGSSLPTSRRTRKLQTAR